MFTEEIINRLPEFQNTLVTRPDLSSIDDTENPLDFVKDNDLINQIFSVNPDTGFPYNDIDVLNSVSTQHEIRDYLIRCLRSIPSVNNPDLSDEDLLALTYNRFEKTSDYVQRLEKFIAPPSDSAE